MKLVFWKHRLARKLAACGLLVPSSLFAAPLNTNLVVNPSFAEVDEDDFGPSTSVRVFDWEGFNGDEDDNYAYSYSSNYGGFPEPENSGDYHYTGGFATTPGEAHVDQLIDVSHRSPADGAASATHIIVLNRQRKVLSRARPMQEQ